MKLDNDTQDVAIHGDFETSEFTIGDIAFIVDMFADKVYTYKERAVIRELSCNAHDSHIMAGTTDIPFDVHLPTQLEPFFSIRDYGTGLSDKEIRSIFAGIGVSTKRDSNEVIGCFGIGSLSPYSLCDSFTVISYKDGIVRTYSCFRDDERKPVVALLTESATDEDNGMEVSLTVEDKVYEFENEAEHVFRFWEGTLPNINNDSVVKACEEQREKYIFTGADFGLTPSWGSMYAIMGNIAYKIPDELDDFDCQGYLKFNLGELNFDTARENLAMDDKTKEAIKVKTKFVKDKLVNEASQQIEDEPTPFKRAVLAEKLRKGQLGKHIKADLSKFELPKSTKPIVYWSRNYRATDKGETDSVPVGENMMYYKHKDRMATRIREYLKDHSGSTIVMLTDKQIAECNVDPEVVQDPDTIPKVVRQGSYSRAGSTVKTFTFDPQNGGYDRADWWDECELEVDGDEIIFVEINRWEIVSNGLGDGCKYELKRALAAMRDAGMDVPVVHGLKSAFIKTKAFKDSDFISFTDYLERELKNAAPTSYCEYSKESLDKITYLNKCIESDELSELLDLLDSCKSDKVAAMCKIYRVEIENMEPDTFVQECMDNFFDKYMMLEFVGEWDTRKHRERIAKYLGGIAKENTDED